MPKKKKEEEEESELEEEIEEKPEIDTEKLNELLESQVTEEPKRMQGMQIVRGSPSLEQVEVANRPTISLEDEMELQGPISRKKDDEIKYESVSLEDYQNPNKKEDKQYQEGSETISASSNVRMETLGRQPERMGREFHISQPEELSNKPASVRDYELIHAEKSDEFKGEKTAFQEQLDRRYKIKG